VKELILKETAYIDFVFECKQ